MLTIAALLLLQAAVYTLVQARVTVDLPDSLAATLKCAIGADAVVVATHPKSVLALQCSNPESLLSCDAAGVEPMDVPIGDVCRTGQLQVRQASAVTISAIANTPVVVEWLSMNTAQKTMAVLARRQLLTTDIFQLQVAVSDDRYVRFIRERASPVTVRSRDLVKDIAWTLPAPRGGGELVLVSADALILPSSYRLAGSTVAARDIRVSRFIAEQGLPAGEFDIQRLYKGSVTGRSLHATIETERSTVRFVPFEDVGGVTLTATAPACAQANALRLTKLVSLPGGGTAREHVARLTDPSACTWTIEGLGPGRYEASAMSSEGLAGNEEFDVEGQSVTRVTLRPAGVIVEGRLTYNDAPIDNAHLRFSRDGGAAQTQVVTNASGTYRLALDRPGEYRVIMADDSFAMQGTSRHFVEGTNGFEWDLEGGSLEVRLKGWNQASPAVVNIIGDDSSVSRSLRPGAEPTIRIRGFKLGEYKVAAQQEHIGLVSELVAVRLTASRLEAIVTLDLTSPKRRLVLRDGTGRPVSGAVLRDAVPEAIEVEPGVYAIHGVPPGAALRIKPPAGYVPTCRIIPAGDLVDVTLQAGRVAELVMPVGIARITRQAGAFIDVPTSECPVPLTDFWTQPLPGDEREPARFVVEGFPIVPFLMFEARGRRARIDASGRIVLPALDAR